jgi:alpha-ketoglutaric semialdehyde dehydrogenase
VVFKPSDDSPHSANIFAEILEEAGLPKGVFNVVHGSVEAGKALVEHADVKLIGFTGSTTVGKAIAAKCGEMNKKVSLEMGGKNAQIVMPDADMDLAIDGVLWGAFGTTGQRCTATSRLILHTDIHDAFVERLINAATKLVLGDGRKAGTQVGPVINERQVKKILDYIEIGKQEGTLVLGGTRHQAPGTENGWFVAPTIFTDIQPTHRLFQEEIFGPVLSVARCTSFEEGIAMANDSSYGLSSSIYTRDVNAAFRAIRDLEAGITYINAPTIGAEAHMPFGGIKGTGNGHREGGWTAFEIFTEWKTVYVDYSGSLQRAQIDNY